MLFSIRRLGLAKARGRFDRFETSLEVGPTLAETRVSAMIDLASINTNNTDRETHLRSTEFFSTDEHPEMHFVSHGIQPAGEQWDLQGEIALNEHTRLLNLAVEFNGVQEFPGQNRRHAGFSATGSLRRSEFGIEFGLLPIGIDTLALGDEVQIEFDLEFVEPQGETTALQVDSTRVSS